MGKYRPGQDREMMQDAFEWPRWPHLPLKRNPRWRGKGPRYGYLEAVSSLLGEPVKPTVWIGILDTVQADRPKIEYESFEALLADGWLVD